MANADKIASQVKTDIIAGYFDFTLEKYQPKVKQPDNVIPINKHIVPNLKDIWEQYKLSKRANLEASKLDKAIAHVLVAARLLMDCPDM